MARFFVDKSVETVDKSNLFSGVENPKWLKK